MPLQKISGTDDHPMGGFVVTDLPDVPADGVLRCARKILQDGARTMARSRTYSWALLEQRRSGASAGISVEPEHRDVAVATFVAAVSEQVAQGSLSLEPGKGVEPADLAELTELDPRAAALRSPAGRAELASELLVAGVLGAASATGELEGRTVAIEGAGPLGPLLGAALVEAGANVTAVATSAGTLIGPPAGAELVEAWQRHGETVVRELGTDAPPAAVFGTTADLLLCGSKLGVLDHDVAATLEVGAVVPIGPAPVTAKALAGCTRRGITVLADFLTLAGPLQALEGGGTATSDELIARAGERGRELGAASLAGDDDAYLSACRIAESFLSSWLDELPFGRPLA